MTQRLSCDTCGFVEGSDGTGVRPHICQADGTVMGFLCDNCRWDHYDACQPCMADFEEDQAQLADVDWNQHHPDAHDTAPYEDPLDKQWRHDDCADIGRGR